MKRKFIVPLMEIHEVEVRQSVLNSISPYTDEEKADYGGSTSDISDGEKLIEAEGKQRNLWEDGLY